MPQIMTKEYCLTCPFFTPSLGYLKPESPYWEEHPDTRCVCKDCPRRQICEEGAKKDFIICLAVWLEARGIDAVKTEICKRGQFEPSEVEKTLKQLLALSG